MNYIIILLVAGLTTATSASASTITIGTDEGLVRPGMDNQGFWEDNSPNNNPTNDNYFTGTSFEIAHPDDVEVSHRSYFTFDLSGLVGQVITSLTLNLRRYDQTGTVELGFWDVSTSAADLAQRNVYNPAIWEDLGTGTSYGSSGPIADGASTDVLSFSLNADAVADANAAIGGYFSIGASVNGPGVIFASSGGEPGNGGPGYTQDLVLETVVPLPAAGWLLPVALGGLFAVRRKA